MRYRIALSLVLLAALASNVRADGDRVALCVGINQYEDGRFEKLEYAEKDVSEFAAILRDVGYKVVLMTAATGKTDPKLAPTKKNLDAQIEAVLEKRKRDDLIVVAYVGHSLQFENDPDSYFCPIDATQSREKRRTLLSLKGLYGQLGRCGAGAKVLLADCSHKDKEQTDGSGTNDDVLWKVPPPGVLALFACSPDERSYENKKLGHGMFFHRILERLKTTTTKRKDEVEFFDLAKEVIREVPGTINQIVEREKRMHDVALQGASGPMIHRYEEVRPGQWKLQEVMSPEEAKLEKEQFIGGTIVTQASKASPDGPVPPKPKQSPMLRGSLENSWVVLLTRSDRELLADYQVFEARRLVKSGFLSYFNDSAKRVAAWKAAAERSCPLGMILYAQCLQDGAGVDEDRVEAFRWYRKAVELGSTTAMFALGRHFEEVRWNFAESLKWYRKAAELGSARAMMALGKFSQFGLGTRADAVEGVKWFRKAAENGDADGMYALSLCYREGECVAQDASEAVKWCRKAAERGNADAMYGLGKRYDFGDGVARDRTKAFQWYRKAAELGLSEAMNDLGVRYRDGLGVIKDAIEGVKWFRKAVELEDATAMANLGWCYQYGEGVEKDFTEAAKLYRKGAILGDLFAMNNLAVLYMNGSGVRKDEVEGVKWFRNAADLGSAGAMFNLGMCYLKGEGVDKDLDEAVKWFRKAAELGSIEARYALRALNRESR